VLLRFEEEEEEERPLEELPEELLRPREEEELRLFPPCEARPPMAAISLTRLLGMEAKPRPPPERPFEPLFLREEEDELPEERPLEEPEERLLEE
jgi:hypothetical protein